LPSQTISWESVPPEMSTYFPGNPSMVFTKFPRKKTSFTTPTLCNNLYVNKIMKNFMQASNE